MTDLPPPPVPADCDLRDLDGFLLNVERLLASELWALASAEEFRAAMSLWCRAWKQVPAASLPDDERTLAAFAGVSLARWAKVRSMAMRGFDKCADGRLYHRTLAADAMRAMGAKAKRASEKAAEAERLRAYRERKKAEEEAARTGVRTVYGTGTNGVRQDRTGQGQDRTGQNSIHVHEERAGDGEALTTPDLPPRLREAYREIAQAEGGGPAGFALANRALAAARRMFRVPTEAQLRETYRAAAEAGVADQDPARWPDFRDRMRQERAQERTGSTAGLDASRADHFAHLDAAGASR